MDVSNCCEQLPVRRVVSHRPGCQDVDGTQVDPSDPSFCCEQNFMAVSELTWPWNTMDSDQLSVVGDTLVFNERNR